MGGHIARMWKDEGILTEQEAKELCSFVFIAGHDTTTILLANAFRIFAEQPGLLRRIRETPADAGKFAEELGRHSGAVHRASRITTEAVEVAGVTLAAGSIVRLLNASASRDLFEDGDIFDMDHDNSMSLGFGHGVHSCLGQPLALLETTVTAEVLARRLASVTLDPAHRIEWVRGNNLTNAGPHRMSVFLEEHND
jgi:cytochrome P450